MSTFTLSRADAREFDRRAIHDFGVPNLVLMENAGRGAAELLMRLNPDRRPTVVLCGPGNNGGDGFVVARHLDNHGWPARVVAHHSSPEQDSQDWAGERREYPPDASTNWRIVARAGLEWWPEHRSATDLESVRNRAMLDLRGCWVVDALFGTGLSRPLDDPFDRVADRVNDSGCPVLALDIPSGLDADTGEPLGPTVRATHTATFVAPKRGFLNPAARAWTGEVHVIDIGAPRALVEEYRDRPTA
ncbi:MAG: NAD(P)H-hydrate epimerase [Isosphaera sp.]|nr:NAD(P)H-hydrate epimerase [Isosphaera sp.]